MTIDSISRRPFAHMDLPEQIAVGNRLVGKNKPVFIVAEVGCNHNGDVELAKRHIAEAAVAGADAVKFQKRMVNDVFIREMREMKQTKTLVFGKTYGEYREFQELTLDEYAELKKFAEKLGLFFFVTPFDLKSVDFLEELGVDGYKISSFDVTYHQLVEKVAKLGKPIFLSVGMSTEEEMDQAVDLILKYNQQLIINHCVSTYPTPLADIHLNNIKNLLDRYHPLPIGYSGHEKGIMPTVMAAAMGACTVERHVTVDKTLPGPDHATVSLDMNELRDLVYHIRKLEKALGDSHKKIRQSEIRAREKHSKSIVAKVRIPVGTPIGIEMLTFKSPGSGIKPYKINELLGKVVKVDIEEDTVIPKEALNW